VELADPRHTARLYDNLIDAVADGESLTAACKRLVSAQDEQHVSWHTVRRQFYRDLNDDPELALNYARASELDADRSFERIEEAVQAGINAAQDPSVDPKTVNAQVHAHKNMADALKWIAARKNRRKYGDKLDLDGDFKHTHTFADLAKMARDE